VTVPGRGGPRATFLLAGLATIAVALLATPSRGVQIALLAPLIAFLGVPHGALDLHMASRLWPLARRRARWAFGLGYLGVAVAVLALWLVAPGAALVAFLAYSALHFGGDWRSELPALVRVAAGLAVVALPAWRFEAEVTALFTVLAPPVGAISAASFLHNVAPWATVIAIGGAVARRRLGATFELAALAALATLAPPLLYFVTYFCGLHSPRHFVETREQLALDLREGAAAALPLTALTWVFAAVAVGVLTQGGVPLDRATVDTVFIGLAALAVPHMLLVERFWTRRLDGPPAPAQPAPSEPHSSD
jgi:Brp/Blh family beta-carotene 15,15'-monooxygenase